MARNTRSLTLAVLAAAGTLSVSSQASAGQTSWQQIPGGSNHCSGDAILFQNYFEPPLIFGGLPQGGKFRFSIPMDVELNNNSVSINQGNQSDITFTWQLLDEDCTGNPYLYQGEPLEFPCLSVRGSVSGGDGDVAFDNVLGTADPSQGTLIDEDEVVIHVDIEDVEDGPWNINISIEECSLVPDLPGGFNTKPRQPVTTAANLPDTL